MSERDTESSTLPGMEADLFPPQDVLSEDVAPEADEPAGTLSATVTEGVESDLEPVQDPAAAGQESLDEPGAEAPPAAEEPPPEPEFPKALVGPAEKLSQSLNDPTLLPQAFADFCSTAYAKPEWVVVASVFLAEQFEDREEELADMARIPDLVIELASGHYALTFMAASVWAERCDTARLARLAEALMAKFAVKSMPGSAEVVDLMLALATSLAVSRYPRAEQLVNLAVPLVQPEHQEALAEARQWLAVGRLVRACDQDARDLWDQRLRRPRHAWTWDQPAERAALAQLGELLTPGADGMAFFQPIVPACWWDLAQRRSAERAEFERALETLPPGSEPAEKAPADPATVVVRQPIVIWRAVPFFVGGLVGAWAFALGVWLGPFELVRPRAEDTPARAGAGVEPLPLSQEAMSQSGDASSAQSAEPVRQTAAPTATPPVEVSANHPDRVWREEEKARLLAEHPGLAAWTETFRSGSWAEHRTLLEGADPALPKDDPEYVRLLVWLHLVPAADAEVNARVPGLLAAYQPESFVLDLWQRLVYPGSPNAAQIKQAARSEHHERTQSWSPSQRARLNLIGWPPEP